MAGWHLITCEFPPMTGGVSDHSRLLADVAAARGLDVHVWAPAGAAPRPGLQVHDVLGDFRGDDLARADRLLSADQAPRRLVVQWVPHGYRRRGLNVRFSRWIARRARAGDEIDVIVHEPFVDFFGRSWMQPVRAVVQRYMARLVLRSARRVWVSIPGWNSRLETPWLQLSEVPRVLPVPGTIPVHDEPEAAAAIRRRLLGDRGQRIVGYFGAGGVYAERALAAAVAALRRIRPDVVVVCFGRGSDRVAARLTAADRDLDGTVSGTGELQTRELSHYLLACDLVLQPYEDGVSGRRTTTTSALEHGVPVATTLGALSEPFWRDTDAVEAVPASAPASLAGAVERLLEPSRNAEAREGARRLYQERFNPGVAFAPLFAD